MKLYTKSKGIKEDDGVQYLEKIVNILQDNKIYDTSADIVIYLVNNQFIYYFINPIELLPNRQTYALTLGSKIFTKNTNLEKNLIYADSNDKKPENLDAILVHEAIHVLQNKHYGWFYTSFRMSHWVKEGYPIYSARKLSIYTEEVLIDYLVNKDSNIKEWSIFGQDQFYSLMVKHAIEKMNKTVDELHLGKVNYDEVIQSLLKEYNITKEEK